MNVLRFLFAVMLGVWIISASLQRVCADPPPATSAPANSAPTDRVTLTYTPTANGDIVIPVTLNGNVPATFLLNTASNLTMISQSMVKKLGLTPQTALQADGKPYLRAGQPVQTVTTALQIGSLSVPASPLLVSTDSDAVLSDLVGHPIDGILGANVLASLPVLIDFQQHQVTFFAHTPVSAVQLQSVGLSQANSSPLQDEGGNDLFSTLVHLANGEQSADEYLVINTASRISMISKSSVQQLKLKSQGTQKVAASSGSFEMGEGTLPVLLFLAAGVDAHNVALSYPQDKSAPGFVPSLGTDALSPFLILLDYGDKNLYIKPNPAVPVPDDGK